MHSDLESEVRRLESDLYMARRTILEMTPEPLRKELENYIGCKTFDEAYRWRVAAVERILELVQPQPAREMGDHSGGADRALCPLCGGGSQSPYGGRGFAYPEGLKRHLEGSYNSHQCAVMEAVSGLCRSGVRMELERQERAQAAVRVASPRVRTPRSKKKRSA